MEDKTILYGNPCSPPTNAVKIFLKICNIPYEFKEVNIYVGEHKTEEFKKLNPLSKIPVLVDQGIVLRESMVICRYLANSRNIADQWYPKDATKRALVDLGLEYWSQNMGRFFAITLQSVGKNDLTKEKAIENTQAAIKDLEEFFLKNSKFVAGDHPTLADLPFLFYLLGQTFFTGCNYAEHKRLNQWIEELYQAEPKLKEQITEYQEQAAKFLEIVKKAFAKK